MPAQPPTITETKATFLRAQIRQLSAPLQPSTTWQHPPPSSSSSSSSEAPAPIPAQTLAEILSKIHSKIKTHNRMAFSTASQRHVAEQIDTLYWNEVTSDPASEDDGTVYISRSADLRDTGVLASLPEGAVDAGRRGRACGLARRRDEVARRTRRYRALRALLVPFEGAASSVQPNLVTRDGELARELERLRVLVARVVAGMGVEGRSLGDAEVQGGEAQRSTTVGDRAKLARVMELG